MVLSGAKVGPLLNLSMICSVNPSVAVIVVEIGHSSTDDGTGIIMIRYAWQNDENEYG